MAYFPWQTLKVPGRADISTGPACSSGRAQWYTTPPGYVTSSSSWNCGLVMFGYVWYMVKGCRPQNATFWQDMIDTWRYTGQAAQVRIVQILLNKRIALSLMQSARSASLDDEFYLHRISEIFTEYEDVPFNQSSEKSDVNGCYIWIYVYRCSSFKDACSSLEDVDSCQENREKCRALHRYHPSIHIQMALWGTNESKLGSLAGFDPVDLYWNGVLTTKGCAVVVPHSGRRDYYTYHMAGKLLALWLPI